MGCDIHAAIEYREPDGDWFAVVRPNKYFGKWDGEQEFTAKLNFGRDYLAFAMLANVRNGGDAVVPMTDNRGLPIDISPEAEAACDGDHSATFVTLAEMLNYDWTQALPQWGYVSGEEFERWDRTKEWNPVPRQYSSWVCGGAAKEVTNEQMREHVENIIGDKRGSDYTTALELFKLSYGHLYTKVEWTQTYAEAADELWNKVIPEMLKLGAVHGFENVRLVMNFDN